MEQANHNIKCNVKTCEYHAGQVNYCTREGIQVGCCDTTPRRTAATPSVLLFVPAASDTNHEKRLK